MQGSPYPRVLCVDDNRDAADSTAIILELHGFECRACYDGFAALDLVESFQPDVCLIDLNMPGMDGDVLAVKLKATHRTLLLVAVTAMSDAASERRTAAAGFDRHLVKPVEPSLWPDVVKTLARS